MIQDYFVTLWPRCTWYPDTPVQFSNTWCSHTPIQLLQLRTLPSNIISFSFIPPACNLFLISILGKNGWLLPPHWGFKFYVHFHHNLLPYLASIFDGLLPVFRDSLDISIMLPLPCSLLHQILILATSAKWCCQPHMKSS